MPGTSRHVSLWCLALLLSLAVGALAARQEDNKPAAGKPTTEVASTGGKYGRYKHHGDHREHYSGYEHHDHPPYDQRPPHKGRDDDGPPYGRPGRGYEHHEGPPYEYHPYPGGYDDPSRDYYYGDEGPHNDYYPHHKECTACPKNTTKCPNPLQPSGYQCLDTVNSPFSCGNCTTVCQANANCVNGMCECTTGFTDCGGVCVDITSNPNFCGGCGTTPCTNAQFCSNGTCVTGPSPCNPGETQCFPSPSSTGTCVDLQTDPTACGSCNRQCSLLTGDTCTDGKCCVGNGGDCRAGFQCCGWSILSLVPPGDTGIVIPTAKCQSSSPLFPLVPGACCKDRVTNCEDSSECCTGLECTDLGLGFGKQCQPPSCRKPLQTCQNNCCAGLICAGIVCIGVPLP